MGKQIDMDKAARLWNEGVTIVSMCAELNTTEKTFQLIKRANPETFPPRKKPVKGVHIREEVSKAEKLWSEGKSYTQIAKALGKTRSAISGMMNRNRSRFPERFGNRHKNHVSSSSSGTPKKSNGEFAKEARTKRTANEVRRIFNEAFKVAQPIPSKAENEEYDKSRIEHAVSLFDLDSMGCKWAVQDSPYLFCGERRYKMKPWCEAHHQRAWRAQ